MSQFEFKSSKVENLKSELISDYMINHKLPEINPNKIKKMAHIACIIEYKSGVLLQVLDIKGMMVNPKDPPVAISCFGTGEKTLERKAA